MSNSADVASAILDVERVERQLEDLHSYEEHDYEQLAELVLDYKNAVSNLKNAASWAVSIDLEEIRHMRYDCGRRNCTHEYCKQNPDGFCENCGVMRRVGLHYLNSNLWGYACERVE